ncbi:hypothetical protein KW783_02410 [Candidatus Parcubacteria bacterium]|nr:hypothetical protein [Candidatus Parcubacteria bacterium]
MSEHTVKPVESGLLVLASEDARRKIFEFNFSDAAVKVFNFHQTDKPLANHFHKNKDEFFLFLEGGGVVFTAAVDVDGKIIGEIKRHDVGPMCTICIRAWNTHRFDLKPGTKFVEYSTKPFDKNDMYASPIEFPKQAM